MSFISFLLFVGAAWVIASVGSNKKTDELRRRVRDLERELTDLGVKVTALRRKIFFPEESEVEKSEETKFYPEPEAIKSSPEPEIPRPEPISPVPHEKETEKIIEEKLAAAKPYKIDLENFMGVKLFAWLGSFALFLGAAFLVKYSVEKNLITPLMRVTTGFVMGFGCLAGGMTINRQKFSVTVQSLCASGIAILYVSLFASYSIYNFISQPAAFFLMILVTATSFIIALRLDSKYVALLGMAGGFLTPVLISTGVDNPIGLFSYIAVLDAGIIAIALKKDWAFLIPLAAAATFIMEISWVAKFFTVDKAGTGIVIFSFFAFLFIGIFKLAEKFKRQNKWINIAASYLPLLSMLFTLYLIKFPELGNSPIRVFSFMLLLNTGIAYLAVRREEFQNVLFFSGMVSFGILLFWTNRYLNLTLLLSGLSVFFIFALLHSFLPVILRKYRPASAPYIWGYLYAPLMLVLIMFPMLREATVSLIIWPFVLLISAVALVVSILSAATWLAVSTLVMTMAVLSVWVLKVNSIIELPLLLMMLTFFTLFFFAFGLYGAGLSVWRKRPRSQDEEKQSTSMWDLNPEQTRQMPALSILLPFILLSMAIQRIPMDNPSPVFGLVLLLVVLIIGLVRFYAVDTVAVAGLLAASLTQYIWYFSRFNPSSPGLTLLWYVIFYGVFTFFPFFFMRNFKNRIIPWAVSAFAGPIHFYLIYKVIAQAAGTQYIGLLPVVFAGVSIFPLMRMVKEGGENKEVHLSQLALYGGITLFFITLMFPLQFEKQWITVGWALEGAALLWLFRRVPHEGLKMWGTGLLIAAFARLALNPAVFSYHPRQEIAIFNWYLYSYGIVTLCLFAGARTLKKIGDEILNVKMMPVLNVLAIILAFLLVNIEVADYFSTGKTLTFDFSGAFAKDMTYSLSWTVFAFVLMIVGIIKENKPVRMGSIGLFGVTILKVFFRDLWQLGQLYRVGSIIGLALVLLIVSFLYQKFIAEKAGGLNDEGEGNE